MQFVHESQQNLISFFFHSQSSECSRYSLRELSSNHESFKLSLSCTDQNGQFQIHAGLLYQQQKIGTCKNCGFEHNQSSLFQENCPPLAPDSQSHQDSEQIKSFQFYQKCFHHVSPLTSDTPPLTHDLKGFSTLTQTINKFPQQSVVLQEHSPHTTLHYNFGILIFFILVH